MSPNPRIIISLFLNLQVGSGHIVDATLEEEACSMACIVAAVNKEGAIDGMVKKGSGSLTIDSIYKMLTVSFPFHLIVIKAF